MKKSIIAAGAASVALAAMPIVGVFAATADPIVDNLTVNLQNTCNITRTGADGADGTWTADGTSPTTAAGTYTATVGAGSTAVLGTSTIKVTCNDTQTGHSLAAAFTDLTASVADNPSLSSAKTIAYSNSAVGTTTSGWNVSAAANATLGITAGIISASSGNGVVYANTKAPVNESEVVLTYNLGTNPAQDAATYKGSATYTLTYGV